jgi:hypothetical protein
VKKIMLTAVAALAIAAVPALAAKPPHPTQAQGPKSSHNSPPSKSHKCKPHKVAWIVSGTLVSQSLTKNADGTYSGTVTMNVTHTNHHAKGEVGPGKTYTLTNVKASFGVPDRNASGGASDLADVQAGDNVKLIGKVTTLAKKCDHTGFTPTVTVRKVSFTAPEPA